MIDGDLRRDALSLQKSGDWDDQGPQAADAIGAESGGTSAMNRYSSICFKTADKKEEYLGFFQQFYNHFSLNSQEFTNLITLKEKTGAMEAGAQGAQLRAHFFVKLQFS